MSSESQTSHLQIPERQSVVSSDPTHRRSPHPHSSWWRWAKKGVTQRRGRRRKDTCWGRWRGYWGGGKPREQEAGCREGKPHNSGLCFPQAHPRLSHFLNVANASKYIYLPVLVLRTLCITSHFSLFSTNAFSLKFSLSFSRGRAQGLERPSSLPKAPHRGSPGARIWAQVCSKSASPLRASQLANTHSSRRCWSTVVVPGESWPPPSTTAATEPFLQGIFSNTHPAGPLRPIPRHPGVSPAHTQPAPWLARWSTSP